MLFTLLPIVMLVKLVQSEKAQLPMLVTLLPIVIDCNAVFRQKGE